MKKIIVVILFFPLLVGWNWQTHSKLVESAYYSLEGGFIPFLDVAALMNGSLAPDRDFHDNRLHHYPPSYNKTLYWLTETKKALEGKKYSNASYAFGVASHYISDSFAAPHNIKKESSKDHAAYEKQADQHYLYSNCATLSETYVLHQKFLEATEQGKTWEKWLETRDEEIPEKAAQEAYAFILQVAKNTFAADCKNTTTVVTQQTFPTFTGIEILFLSLIIYSILSLMYSFF
tara:strand:- start:14534 stop:15232 length:699 start_codon:yes stop_codon:yes gene_type:complete